MIERRNKDNSFKTHGSVKGLDEHQTLFSKSLELIIKPFTDYNVIKEMYLFFYI